jgi:hypothetical protein
MKIPSSELSDSLDDEGDDRPRGYTGEGGTVTKLVGLESAEEESSEEVILRETMVVEEPPSSVPKTRRSGALERGVTGYQCPQPAGRDSDGSSQ